MSLWVYGILMGIILLMNECMFVSMCGVKVVRVFYLVGCFLVNILWFNLCFLVFFYYSNICVK